MAAVAQRIGADRSAAERASRATLAVLADRLGKDEAGHLLPQLSDELGGWVFAEGGAKGFGADEFVRRVAEREGVDPTTAERHAAAVLAVLRQAVGDELFAHVRVRLSKDYAPLLPAGPYAGAAAMTEFRPGAEAVLETLAERIAPGETEQLRVRLPVALHPALERGEAHPDPRMSRQEFVRRVARRARMPEDRAAELAREVFARLRQILREDFPDVTVQLSPDYRDLIPAIAR
jgi:uncharacterized protein (DUF2267 family)